MKMKDHVNRYLELRRPGVSAGTHKDMTSALTRLADAWDKTRRVPNRIDEDWMVDFLIEFRNGGHGGLGRTLAASSYNKAIERYQGFFQWLLRRGGISPLVLDSLQRFREEKAEYLQLSAAQVVHMIETCADPWERWVLAFGSQTLGRDSELRNRQVKHLHLDRGVLDWYRKKTIDLDKLPVTRQLAAEWQRWAYVYQSKCGSIQPDWPLIPRRWGNDINRTYYADASPAHGLSQIVQKHASRVSGLTQESLKGQGVHILRRSMARALYERLRDEEHAEPLRVVQALLGHGDPKTTRIYIGLKPDREERNALLVGSDLLWTERDNIVQLRSVSND